MVEALMSLAETMTTTIEFAEGEKAKLIERVKKITTWRKFYIGKWQGVEMIAVRSVTDDPAKFAACVKTVLANGNGFPLIGGASIAWPSQSACWAISGSGDSSTVRFIDFPA